MPVNDVRRRVQKELLKELEWHSKRAKEIKASWDAKVPRLPKQICIDEYLTQLSIYKTTINNSTTCDEFQSIQYDMRDSYSVILLAYYEAESNIEILTSTEPFTRVAHFPHAYGPFLSAVNRSMRFYCGLRTGKHLWKGLVVTTHGRDVEIRCAISLLGVPSFLINKGPILIGALAHEAAHYMWFRNTKFRNSLLPCYYSILCAIGNIPDGYRNPESVISITNEIIADSIGAIIGGPLYSSSLERYLMTSPSATISNENFLDSGYLPHIDRIALTRYIHHAIWGDSFPIEQSLVLQNETPVYFNHIKQQLTNDRLNEVVFSILSQCEKYHSGFVSKDHSNIVNGWFNAYDATYNGNLLQLPTKDLLGAYYLLQKHNNDELATYVPLWLQLLSISKN